MHLSYTLRCFLASLLCTAGSFCMAQSNDLKIVLIRHAEKPEKGPNLSCQGQNRAIALPDVIIKKFGKPAQIFVPAMSSGKKTMRSRMFETATPLATKYNINVNSQFAEQDYHGLANFLLTRKGTILVIWEHDAIPHIAKALGASKPGKWHGKDFDSIWIINAPGKKAALTMDHENLHPSPNCR